MKVIVIPDIHQKQHIAEYIIRNENPDKVIFLGDYFDSFRECADDTRETAKWLKWSLSQSNRIHIIGNHDVSYWFPGNRYLECPGWEPFKQLLVNDHLQSDDWEKFHFFYNLDNKWLLSHAGIHPYWFVNDYGLVRPARSDIPFLENFLGKEVLEFKRKACQGQDHWFNAYSRARCGVPHYGGLLWNDFSGDFHAILGVNQLVGHSPADNPRWVYIPEGSKKQQWYGDINLQCHYGSDISYNLCLDTGLHHYAAWNGKKLTIKSIEYLTKKANP